MAAPAAIVALVRMSRAAFNRYAQSESITAFAREIDGIVRDQRQDYMVFTYVADAKCFFYFQVVNHPGAGLSEGSVVTALKRIGEYLDDKSAGSIVVHPGAPNFLADSPVDAFEIRSRATIRVDALPASVMAEMDALIDRFFYAVADARIPFEDWLKRKDLNDPALDKAYQRILKEQARHERSQRISAATPDDPVRLFSLYVYDGTTVSMAGSGQVLEDADPYSLHPVKGGDGQYVADDRFAYRLGAKIPLAHGPSFRCLAAHDNIHNLDRNHAYYFGQVIEGADPATFETMDYSYARDQHYFYSGGTRLGPASDAFEIDVCGFLKTPDFIHHYTFRIPLDPATFEILDLDEHSRSTNPFIGTYLLRDQTGVYSYDSSERTMTLTSRR